MRGDVFVRNGAKRDICENPRANTPTQVPRDSDVNALVAKEILKFFSQ